MTANVEARYLRENFAPVEEEVTAIDLPVTGRVPATLEGRYLRNGPNPVAPVDPRTHHWFVGTGMVHGVRLRGGRAEWYRNRYVRGDQVAEVQGLPRLEGRAPGMFAGSAPNTNVIGHAGTTWAIVEAGGQPVELSYELESLRYVDFDGQWPGAFSAHPKRDPDTGELHVIVYGPELQGLRYVVVGADGAVRSVVPIDVPGQTMVHDTAITASKVIVFDLPVTFSMQAIVDGYPFPYRWDADYTPRVGVLPRGGTADDIRWCEVGSCYVYHPLNAYDLPDGRIVLDVARHPKMFATDVNGPWEGLPTLDRWLIDPASGVVKEERLDDRGQEFPRVDERVVGKPHRYGWCAEFSASSDGGPEMGSILKHDLERGTTEAYDLGLGRSSGEAVFVPRDDDAGEDDGWVMSLVYDRGSDSSELVILDAQDMEAEPVARVHLPQRVPYGFHGNWVPDR
jgi:carotenoid cleavage dioxygenase